MIWGEGPTHCPAIGLFPGGQWINCLKNRIIIRQRGFQMLIPYIVWFMHPFYKKIDDRLGTVLTVCK